MHCMSLDRALMLADAMGFHQRLFGTVWSLQFGPSLFGIYERVVSSVSKVGKSLLYSWAMVSFALKRTPEIK